MKNQEKEIEEVTEVLHEGRVYDTSGLEWRQRGPYLVANKDGIEYAAYIGMKKMMTGMKGDKPILKDR